MATSAFPVPATGPVVRNVVARPRVMRRLDDAALARVILVCAPAGFGKSLAVSSWRQSLAAQPTAWTNLAQVAGSGRTMWTAILGALGTLPLVGEDRAASTALEELTEVASRHPDLVAARLARWTDRWLDGGTLVLDDLHGVLSKYLHAQLLEFIAASAPRLRFVVISRHDPPWPLHRMRLEDLLCDVRADTLRFNAQEAGPLLDNALMGQALPVRLTEADVAALTERTDGWAAGLRLAALGLAAAPDPQAFIARVSGSGGYIADYLMREVWDGFDQERRDLLRTISSVDRVSADLAEGLGAGPATADLLQEMAAENAFITEIGQDPGWYRVHPLLLDFVRSRVTDLVEQSQQLSRVARWHRRQRDPWTALGYAIQAQDWELAGDLAVVNIVRWVVVQPPAELADRLAGIPAEAVAAIPGLGLAVAATRTMTGRVEEVAGLLDGARRSLAVRPREPAAAYRLLCSLIEAGDARWRSDLERLAVKFAEVPVDAQELQASGLADWTVIRVLVLSNVGSSEVWLGRTRAAIGHLRTAGEVKGWETLQPAINARSHLALAYWIRGDLDSAVSTAQGAIDAASRCGIADAPQSTAAYLTMAGVALDRDERDAATGWLEVAEPTAREPHTILACQLLLARVLAARGDGYEAVKLARTAVGRAPATMSPALVARAQYLIRTLDGTTRAVGRPFGVDPSAGDWTDERSLRWRVDGALRTAIDAKPSIAVRQAALAEALDLAAPQLLRRPFLDLQKQLHSVLPATIEAGVRDGAFAVDLLARMTGDDKTHDGRGIFVPLSERELNILRYLVSSLTTAEIADALYISVNTVKTHQRAVYQKLGVSGRRQAVARAQQLQLL